MIIRRDMGVDKNDKTFARFYFDKPYKIEFYSVNPKTGEETMTTEVINHLKIREVVKSMNEDAQATFGLFGTMEEGIR
jgi:hypothetical protein